MTSSASAIVVGGGAAGLACAWALARRGVRALVLERHHHIHELGSHGGYTRIIRRAYHEGSRYIELVREAETAWLALERRRGESLLVRTGLFEFGPPGNTDFQATLAACVASEVEHELLDATAAGERWPLFHVPADWSVCYTPSGGFLRVHACMNALRAEARAGGAQFRYGAHVREIVMGRDRPRVLLNSGELIAADHIIVCAGAYAEQLLPGFLDGRLYAQRRVLAWTTPARPHQAALAALPVWAGLTPEGFFYGFPFGDHGVAGFKLARHTSTTFDRIQAEEEGAVSPRVDPERVDREIDDASDLTPLRAFLGRYLPAARGPIETATVCMYGCTPSWDFVLDRAPADPRVIVAAGFSGHGFKFLPAIGRIVSSFVCDAAPAGAVPLFARARHLRASTRP
jgi:monomeric sarcosine oxidase